MCPVYFVTYLPGLYHLSPSPFKERGRIDFEGASPLKPLFCVLYHQIYCQLSTPTRRGGIGYIREASLARGDSVDPFIPSPRRVFDLSIKRLKVQDKKSKTPCPPFLFFLFYIYSFIGKGVRGIGC